MTLSVIDTTIVFFYIAGMLALGAILGKYVRSAKDYFLAGRLLPWWAIGMSVVATDIGAYDFVGASGGAYRYGLVLANFDWIGCIPGMILAAFIFVPYYWRAGVYTIPEYLGRRYNDYVRAVEAILWGVFMICNLGIFLWTTAVMLKPLMGWGEWTSILVTAAVVGIYTVSGGLSAVVITDVIQLVSCTWEGLPWWSWGCGRLAAGRGSSRKFTRSAHSTPTISSSFFRLAPKAHTPGQE